MTRSLTLPRGFDGVGYTAAGAGLPLTIIKTSVSQPGPDQVLVHASWSSLNPLDYKLARLNFMGLTPPVLLGFDLAGVVVAVGSDVRDFAVGDKVMAMVDSNGQGVWAGGGGGGYALARS